MRFFTALFALVVDAGAVESQKLALSAQGKFSVFRIQRLATVQTRPRQAFQIFLSQLTSYLSLPICR